MQRRDVQVRHSGEKQLNNFSGRKPAAGSEKKDHPATAGRKDFRGNRSAEQKSRDRSAEQKSRYRSAEQKSRNRCPVQKKCGGCAYLALSYEEQLKKKETYVRKLMGDMVKVHPVIGMKDPWHYRNKVNAAFQRRRNGDIVSGIYEEGTHHVIQVDSCLIEDEEADRIIGTIRKLVPSFRIRIYDEDSGFGLLRHVMVRKAHTTGQILVILVAASPVFPSRNNFVKALRKEHPEITSVVLNINDRHTSMVLGDRNIVLYGKGWIEDELCGKTFRISPQSFYQVNSVQTEVLYGKAMELASLSGDETVIDAYSGIGTIGIVASDHAGRVVSVESNKEAVRDAFGNAKRNHVRNIRFVEEDATEFMEKAAAAGERADVIFMDPPRSGSTEAFIRASVSMQPEKIVYISCNPETLTRNLRAYRKMGYEAREAWPVDMFPWTRSVETVCQLQKSR